MLAVCPLKWVKHQRRSGTAWESFGSHILQASKRRPSGESVWGELLPTLGSALARSRGATRPLEDGLVKACYQTLVSADQRPFNFPCLRDGWSRSCSGRLRHTWSFLAQHFNSSKNQSCMSCPEGFFCLPNPTASCYPGGWECGRDITVEHKRKESAKTKST